MTGPKTPRKSSSSPAAKAPAKATQAQAPAKKVKTARTGSAAGGRPQKWPWDSIRLEYIKGSDDLTYAALAHKSGYPSKSVIENRAAQENWSVLRAQFREQVMKLTIELETKLQATPAMAAIAAVRERQASAGIRLQEVGLELVEDIRQDPERWAEANLSQARLLVQGGAQLERSARGMEEYSINLNDLSSPADLAQYSPDQLIDLLNRFRKARGMTSSSSPVPMPLPLPGQAGGQLDHEEAEQ